MSKRIVDQVAAAGVAVVERLEVGVAKKGRIQTRAVGKMKVRRCDTLNNALSRSKVLIFDNLNTKSLTYLTNHQHKATASRLVFILPSRHTS